MKTFVIRLIIVTLFVGVTFGLIFGQAGTCPNGYGNQVNTKNCYTQPQNFAQKATFQTSIVQKGSPTDSFTITTSGGNTTLAHGIGSLVLNSSKAIIGAISSTGYRVSASTNNIQIQQGSTDSCVITFANDTMNFNATVLAYTFTPKLDANSVTGFWGTSGNAGTIPGTNFIGTTDAQPVVIMNQLSGALILVGNGATFGKDNKYIGFDSPHSAVFDAVDSIFLGAQKATIINGLKTIITTPDVEIYGALKYTGSTPAAGKVLTSDASGNATWETPSSQSISFADLTAQTTGVATVCAYTPSADGTFRIGGYVNITAVTAGVITFKVTYKDINGQDVTQIIPLTIAATGAVGTTATVLNSNNSATDVQIRAQAGSPITVLTTLTVGTATYDVGGTIEFLR